MTFTVHRLRRQNFHHIVALSQLLGLELDPQQDASAENIASVVQTL